MTTLKTIAKRNVAKMLETQSTFDVFHKLVKWYDLCSKGGNDEQFIIFCMNELGYVKCKSGGWMLDRQIATDAINNGLI